MRGEQHIAVWCNTFVQTSPMSRTAALFSACLLSLSALAQSGTFTLHSADVGGQATTAQVFNGFGCTGANQSPQLSWSFAPAGTKSYAITLYDPDAPTGSGWWHWVVFDIPVSAKELIAGAGTPGQSGLPAGAVQSLTDFGGTGYGGPCPPTGHGPHRYIVTIHALKVDKLGLDEKANPPMVGFNLSQNTLAKASIVFYYER
jgi:Raf kinase inhibitor-like YbhB/YbcL family protein